MSVPSSLFLDKTKRQSVYNIQSIDNIPSIIRHGILSYNRAAVLEHKSIAMSDVQSRRDNILIPDGGSLHDYASAYFDPRNPMLYKRKNMAESLCVLAISSTILDINRTIVSDGNAASGYSRFYSPEEGISKLDFAIIYDKWWLDNDLCEQLRRKRIKCAEILVPDVISYEYIVGAIVVNEQVQRKLARQNFQKDIVIDHQIFFQ